MTDIVERLRIRQPLLGTLCDEAAAEIERLTALHVAAAARAELAQIEIERLQAHVESMINAMKDDNERLRAALQEIADVPATLEAKIDVARRALEPKPDRSNVAPDVAPALDPKSKT